jgi:hypothetical protein
MVGGDVLTKIKRPNHHFKAYYEDNSILIQFVISEFVLTYQLASQIRDLTLKGFGSKQNLEESIPSLFYHFNQLLGFGADPDQSLCWTKGPLTKLKNYCEQFSQNTENQNKIHWDLYTYVHQTWVTALENLELMNIFQQSRAIRLTKSSFLNIKRTFGHLEEQLNQIVKHIPRVLSSYKNNENVLFFLMRKKESLSEIYGSDFLSKIFNFSQTNTLFQLMTKKYIKRGFDHLLPRFEQTSSH